MIFLLHLLVSFICLYGVNKLMNLKEIWIYSI